jgi:hypothetical protein
MAHSSASKKSNKDDSGSDSEEEVNNDPSFLIAENAKLNDLLDNHDDVLRKTNKEKREYRYLLGEAKEKVVELESLLIDTRAQLDSLKSAPVVTNEPECTNCSTFLGELTVLKEKYASKVEELDVLRVELDEMESRPSLLGACTSCPILHEKLDVSLVYARSLEAQLKAPIPTSCSTCEINVVKNMEPAHYVDRLQDENDELRELMGWLSGHEPLLRIMIETYKCQDGEALGANKVGGGSGENKGKIRDIPKPPKTHHKNAFVPKPNHLRNQLDTTPAPLVFPPHTDDFQKPIKFKSDLGNEFFGKKGEKPSEEKLEPKESSEPKSKPKPFHCEHCGRDGHLAEFCFRRKHEERLVRELANKNRYHPSRGVPEPRLVPRGEGMVRTIYPREMRQFVPRGEPPHTEGGRRVGFGCGEFAGRSFASDQYEYGGNDRSFRSQRSYGPRSPLRGTRSPPRGCVGVPPRSDRIDFANPAFEQMARHRFDLFCTNPSVESFAHSCSHFLFCRWEAVDGEFPST